LPTPFADPRPPAILALADGTVFSGVAIGAAGSAVGEVVFNTALTGYQEILTDPSYCRQLVTLTYPHVGNVGVNDEDVESDRIHAAGLIVRDCPMRHSNHRARAGLTDYLVGNGVVGIADVDTRRLTRILRDRGAQAGALLAADAGQAAPDTARAVALARSFGGMAGLDLAQGVSVEASYPWSQTSWIAGRAPGEGYGTLGAAAQRFHVVAYDFGVKRNILRLMADRGCRITVVPARTTAAAARRLAPDGIFLANGPGDPQPCGYAIDAARALIADGVPTFGICLGQQIMALASGARTVKMKFGHHGANHPVLELATGRVMITSQNHGFAVDEASLPANCAVTHRSLFDGSLQGFRRTDRPAFCFQGHPEASPGPHDIRDLFDRFVASMAGAR